MTIPAIVRLDPDEIEPLRSAMRDVQVSIAEYQRQTLGLIAGPDEYTTPVRSAVAFIQKLNDVMRTELAAGDYRALFNARLARGDPGARTIEGFRYVRNVGQHLLHPVVPEAGGVVGSNLGLGFRSWSHWAEVPGDVHARLHAPTQSLKPHYDHLIAGRSTLDPLLDACKFFAEVCPQLVHRDDIGEWTGFPLRVQWGTTDRIHPDEPPFNFADRVGSEVRFVDGSIPVRPAGTSAGLLRRSRLRVASTCVVRRFGEVPRISASPNRSLRSRRTSLSGTSTGVVSRRRTST